jgi:hypothetical protein
VLTGETLHDDTQWNRYAHSNQTVIRGEGDLRHLLDIPAVDPSIEPVTAINGTSFSQSRDTIPYDSPVQKCVAHRDNWPIYTYQRHGCGLAQHVV